MRKYSIAFLFLLGALPLAEANFQEHGLTSVGQWQKICAAFERDDLVSICTAKVHRPVANGRALGIFEPVRPDNDNQLQTRSGVYFKPGLNDLIVHVPEDSGLRTRVLLKEDVSCQVYAAPSDLVGRPERGGNYRRLIEAWLREYTDTPHAPPQIRVGQQDNRHTLQFDVETASQRTISGTYLFDEQANAGIFTTCEHPSQSAAARRHAAQFLRSIIGSARKFG